MKSTAYTEYRIYKIWENSSEQNCRLQSLENQGTPANSLQLKINKKTKNYALNAVIGDHQISSLNSK